MSDHRSSAEPTGQLADPEMTWAKVRREFLRERVEQRGSAEDHVALGRACLQLHGMGIRNAVDEAMETLDRAAVRHPRSVTVWEHVVYLATMLNRPDRQAQALSVLEHLDPGSPVLGLASDTSEEGRDDWASQARETQRLLMDLAQRGDEAQVEEALAELERWTRFAPSNSTYAINLALALMSAGRHERACGAAREAWAVEDGSFADAYNVALVLTHCGQPDAGRPIASIAWTRATSNEERELVPENLGVELA